jgi:hypothetical protein
MSAVLQQHGRAHVVLGRRQAGGRWRTERWESLRFQFPNWSLELLGYAYSGDDPNGFAPRDPGRHRGLRGEYGNTGARAHRCYRPASGRRRVRSVVLGRRDPRRSGCRRDRTVPAAVHPRGRPGRLRHRCSRPIRRATGFRRTCQTAPCWWSAAGRPAARSPTNCCALSAGLSYQSSGTGESRGVPRQERLLVAGADGPAFTQAGASVRHGAPRPPNVRQTFDRKRLLL